MKTWIAILSALCLLLAWNTYTLGNERDYLRGELFRAMGLADKAADTADGFKAIAEQYQQEITELRYERSKERLAAYIRYVNPKSPADRIAEAVVASAKVHDVPIAFIAGVMKVESHFNPNAKGDNGERGLMQILESTAKDLGPGCYTYRIEANVECGVQYLKAHLEKYGSPDLAANRYNGGGDSAYKVRVMAARDAIRRFGV